MEIWMLFVHQTNRFPRTVCSGNGTTACVQLLIDCLGLKHYDSSRGNDQQQNHDKPLVILGPFEHHSNILPWRELGIADIETVGYKDGSVDLQDLERILKKHEHRKSIKIGSFSAASNVTGTVVDDLAITAILHKYGALSVWDYATGASYLEMNMNPTPVTTIHTTTAYGNNPAAFAKDAIFFSGHKLLGGIGTPGVLIVKKKLVSTLNSPDNCGGGTVFYVTEDHHRFLSNRIERYEGGTPNVTGIWRLGLVFRFKLSLKSAIKQMSLHISNENCVNDRSKTCDGFSPNLMVCDLERAKNIQRQLGQIHNLVLLDGNAPDGVPKVPVFSFLIKCGTRFLHYNYVCALLNDLFGIQSRGGCQCAGPYSQFLLGMLDKNGDNLCSNAAVEKWLVNTKDELLRPGATRLSLPTLGTTQKQQDYVLEAIRWIASNGWKMMHVYRCNHRSGEWRHKSRPGAPLGTRDRLWLSHYQTLSSKRQLMPSASPPAAMSLSDALVNANKILEIVLKDQSSLVQALKMVEEGAESPLRWYVYPKVSPQRFCCWRMFQSLFGLAPHCGFSPSLGCCKICPEWSGRGSRNRRCGESPRSSLSARHAGENKYV
jgi:selenocysteine lyase/cysteine desulfurase